MRFRLAEFLGAAAPKLSAEALDELTRDTDPLVRRLARALGPELQAAGEE